MKKVLLSKPGEWADKLGRFLPERKNKDKEPLPRKNSAPNLVNYGAEEEEPEPASDGWEHDDDHDRAASPDPPGPDTSSFPAFLLNLLSIDNKTSNDGGENSSILGFGRAALGFRNQPQAQPQPAEDEGSNAQKGEFYDVDWLLVDEHVKVTPAVNIPRKQLSTITPDRLPRMSDTSSLLTDEIRCSIHPALPTLAKGRRWVLLYSTEKHGMSLLTLYRNSNMMTVPLLLVAGDKEGAVFGGLITAPLVPSPKKKYTGTSDSFVFTNVNGSSTVYHPSGMNRYYVLATTEALALGGGSHFALTLDAELLNGTSGTSETFTNPCLAHSEEFILKHVELWGFDHTQRHSSFSDPSPLLLW